MKDKFAVVLLAMGGPDSTDDIPEFLYNIFSDRAIIRLPGGSLFQRPFARLISKARSRNVAHHYQLIGGGSPLLKWTRAQAQHIESALDNDEFEIKCFIGMRYFRPFIESAICDAYEAGFNRFCFLPMYPHYSTATTGSSFAEANRVLATLPDVESVFISDYHEVPAYLELLRGYINQHIRPDETLLFSAHSLPQRFVDEGDPYVEQVKVTAAKSAVSREYFLSFQSRTGPVKWVGPDTIDEVRRLLADQERKLFIVPISFVCDHIETLYELEIQLREIVGADLAGRIRRMPMFNDDERFGKMLATLVRDKVREHAKI